MKPRRTFPPLLALLVLALGAARSSAESPADPLWAEAGTRAHRIVERLKAWRPSGLRFASARRVDLSDLELRLGKLGETIGWSARPAPDIGIFFDEQRPTVVSQIRAGGPAELAGVRVGDEFLSVDGRGVADYAEIARLTKDGLGPYDVALKGKGAVLLGKSRPEYPPAELMERVEEEFAALRRSFAELKERAGEKDARREELADEAGRLAEEAQGLERRMREIQEESAARYRSS